MSINNNFFLTIRDGFGNKIYRIIIGLYLQQINNKKFNSIVRISKHENKNDFDIFTIFPKLKQHIILFETYEDIDKEIPINNRIDISCTDDFNFNINTYDKVPFITRGSKCFKYVFDIFHKLEYKYKKTFIINQNLISKYITEFTKSKYVLIHIRYGDKLNISYKPGKYTNRFTYLMYTPNYYIKMIKYFQNKNKKILIISDDNTIVKKFILNKVNNNNVTLIDSNFLDSFYLLTKATYIVLSVSTFSFLGTLINLNLKKAYYLKRPTEIYKFITPEEAQLNDKRIKIYENKKYILNYYKDLMKTMINSR
jgi:hypothetical protein